MNYGKILSGMNNTNGGYDEVRKMKMKVEMKTANSIFL